MEEPLRFALNLSFSAPLFQKFVFRKRLFSEMKTDGVTLDLFDRCMTSQDSTVQRNLSTGRT
jgi:hypothetical protein